MGNDLISSGYQQTAWDGLLENGQSAATGVYFLIIEVVEIESGRRYHSGQKLVLIK